MPAQVNLPVPALPGVGANVAIDTMVPVLTMLYFGAPDDEIVIEQTFGLGLYVPLVSFTGGPQTKIVEAEGTGLRARRLKGKGGAYNIQFAQQNQVGVNAGQTINVPAIPGPVASIDISAQPPNLNIIFGSPATSEDVVAIEHSLDNINFAPLASVNGQQLVTVISGANNLRVNRNVAGVAARVLVQGVPKMN